MWPRRTPWCCWSALRKRADCRRMSAVIQSQRELEDVVRDLVSQVHGVAVKEPFDTDDIT